MESDQLFREVQELRAQIESIDFKNSLLIGAQRDNLLPIIKSMFKKRNLRKIYMAIDGKRNLTEISEITGIHIPNITNGCKELGNFGLINLKKRGRHGTVYKKSICEKIFGLSKWIKREFNGGKQAIA